MLTFWFWQKYLLKTCKKYVCVPFEHTWTLVWDQHCCPELWCITWGHHSVRFVNVDPSLVSWGKTHQVLMKGLESIKVILALPWEGLIISHLKHWEGMWLVISKNDLLQPQSGSSTLSVLFCWSLVPYSFSKHDFLLLSVKKMLPWDSVGIWLFPFILVQDSRCQETFANCPRINHQYISNNIDYIEA